MSKKREIEEIKVSRSAKCGVLPCVEIFNKFAGRAESIIMGTDRRTDLDKAYAVLIDAVFRTIERAANEHPKTPPDVIKFGRWTPYVEHTSMLITLNNFNEIYFSRKLQEGGW